MSQKKNLTIKIDTFIAIAYIEQTLVLFFGNMIARPKEPFFDTPYFLSILLSVLIIWNSRYLENIYDLVKNEPWFDEDEFKRVSPLGTSHVNFLGRYIL